MANAGIITLNDTTEIGALSLSEGFVDFYSYGSPDGASSNTGYEKEATAIMFFAEYAGDLALFTLLDLGDATHTTRNADLSLSDFNLLNVLLVVPVKPKESLNFSYR